MSNKPDILTLIEQAEAASAAHAERAPAPKRPLQARPEMPIDRPTAATPQPIRQPMPERRQPIAAPPMQPPAEPAGEARAKQMADAAADAAKVQTRADVAARAAAAATQSQLNGTGGAAPPQPARPAAPARPPKFEEAPQRQAGPVAESAPLAGEMSGASPTSWHDDVPTGQGSVIKKGLLFVFGFLALFAAWALLSPIASAVVAGGKIVSGGQNKLIQHPTGGVVRDIMVADGEKVEAGQVLALLDPSANQAELSRLLARQATLQAVKARYEAENQGLENVAQAAAPEPAGLQLRGGQQIVADTEASDDTTQILDEQKREFTAGRKRLLAQINAIEYQIETLREQRTGLEARLAGARKLLQFSEREIAKIKPLAEQGYLAKSRLWEVEKTQLEQLTNAENLQSEIAATDQRISEAESNLAQLEESDRETRSEEMTRVIGELAEIRDQVKAARNAVNLTTLKAPVDGTIVKLAVHTKGGVVAPGATVAEVVPAGVELETEFRVPLEKSKHVKAGQKARVTVTAFNRRTYDPINAEVTYMAADSVVDEQTGENYFLARAKLIPDPKKNNGIDEISAGMATEVYVLASSRSFASYVVQPIVDSFSKAFREIN